jgi:hypothetical protein
LRTKRTGEGEIFKHSDPLKHIEASTFCIFGFPLIVSCSMWQAISSHLPFVAAGVVARGETFVHDGDDEPPVRDVASTALREAAWRQIVSLVKLRNDWRFAETAQRHLFHLLCCFADGYASALSGGPIATAPRRSNAPIRQDLPALYEEAGRRIDDLLTYRNGQR